MAPKHPETPRKPKHDLLDIQSSSPIAPHRHKTTPKRTAVRTLYRHTDMTKTAIFAATKVAPRTGYRILNAQSDHRDTDHQKTGRPRAISEEKIWEIINWFTDDYMAQTTSWEDLTKEFDLDCTARTTKSALNAVGYKKCWACQRGWISP